MLMDYEAGDLSLWNKTFMFMASGFNATETTRFLEFSDQLIDTLIRSFGGTALAVPHNLRTGRVSAILFRISAAAPCGLPNPWSTPLVSAS
jgi:hypothetical protein